MFEVALVTILLAALFAIADRFSGSGMLQGIKDTFRLHLGRPVYYGFLLTAGALAAIEPTFAWIAVAWLIWRLPGWRFAGGDMDPQNGRETLALALRHMLIGPPLILWAVLSGHSWTWAYLVTLCFAVGAAGLGRWMSADPPRLNWLCELWRGALFGALISPWVLGTA